MNYLKSVKSIAQMCAIAALAVIALFGTLPKNANAQFDDINIVGMDTFLYPQIQLTVEADGLVINEQTKLCSLAILENSVPIPSEKVKFSITKGPALPTRVAFLLDLTTYEIGLNIKERIVEALTTFAHLCNWTAEDRAAIFVPDQTGQNLRSLANPATWSSLDKFEDRFTLVKQVQDYDIAQAPDGFKTITDPDLLVRQLFANDSLPFDGSVRTIIVLFSNGMDRNGIDYAKLQQQLSEQNAELYVIFNAKQDSERNLLNLAEMIDSNSSRYVDLRNTAAYNRLWQSFVNPSIQYQLTYTTTLPPPFSVAVQGQTAAGNTTSLVKPVLTEFQPYALRIITPTLGSTYMTYSDTQVITATIVVTMPDARRKYYPYVLTYNTQPYTDIQGVSLTYTQPLQLEYVFTVTRPLSQATPFDANYTFDVHLFEPKTGLENRTTTFFTVRSRTFVPTIEWPESNTDLVQLIEMLKSMVVYAWYFVRNDFGLQAISIIQLLFLVFVLAIFGYVWVWRKGYNQMYKTVNTTERNVSLINRRLASQQSAGEGRGEGRDTQFWPSPDHIAAELILLQGDGTVYDYIAISKQKTTLGSAPRNHKLPSDTPSPDREHWKIENPWVDPLHCSIENKGRDKNQRYEFWIYDGDGENSSRTSKNGLYVNNKKVPLQGVRLESGDVIGLSRAVKYSFRIQQKSAAVPVKRSSQQTNRNGGLAPNYDRGSDQS